MTKADINQRLRCLELALTITGKPSNALVEMGGSFDTQQTLEIADQFVAYIEQGQPKLTRKTKAPDKIGIVDQGDIIDWEDPSRHDKITKLVSSLSSDNRIVMRAILARAQTDELEEVFREYLPKL